MTESKLTSVRIPPETLKAIQRRAKRLDISQNKMIVALLNQSLGLSEEGFDPNPPLPTDEVIANLMARVEALEKRLAVETVEPALSEPVKDEEPLPIIEAIANNSQGLLTKEQAAQLAIERGMSPESKTPAAKRFGNAYSDFANGKSKKNPEDSWGLQRVKTPQGFLYKDLRA